jgi:hypothetical protein
MGGYEIIVGRFDAAEAYFEEARDIAGATGNPGLTGQVDPGDLVVAAWRGRTVRTRMLAEACTRDATARGVGILVSLAQYALAILEIGLGQYEVALKSAEDACLENPGMGRYAGSPRAR